MSDLPGVPVRVGEGTGVEPDGVDGGGLGDGSAGRLHGDEQLVYLGTRTDVVGKGDAAEPAAVRAIRRRRSGRQTAVRRQEVAVPQDEGKAAGLEEDGLLYLLSAPAQCLVEAPGTGEVADAEGDEGDALVHAATEGDRIEGYRPPRARR